MSGTILGDLVKKWLERKKSRKKEREKKGKRGKKTGIEVEKRKSQSYLTFSSKIISRRVAKGWKTAGSKGERARTEGSTDEQTRMKKGDEESEGSEGKGRETDGRERKVKEKKRREQKAGNCSGEESSDSTSVHNVSREKREGRGEEEGSEAARAN